MIAVGGLISPSIIITSERLSKLSLLSSVSIHGFVDRLLALTLHLSLVESVIDAHHELDILGELARAIHSSDLVLDFFLETLVELGDIGIIVLI